MATGLNNQSTKERKMEENKKIEQEEKVEELECLELDAMFMDGGTCGIAC